MDALNNVYGGSNVSPATSYLTNKYTSDAFAGHLMVCFVFALFCVAQIFSPSWLGLIVAIINGFNLFFWLPKLIFSYKVWRACKTKQ